MEILRKKIIQDIHRKRSTLLIPDFLFSYYQNKRDHHGGLKNLLGFLIRKFNCMESRLFMEDDISSTIDYQEKGLFLHREDFRPIENEWIELKLLASSHNLSMCKFFVLLLRLEMAGALDCEDGYGGVPPNPKKITLIQTISPTVPQNYLHTRTLPPTNIIPNFRIF